MDDRSAPEASDRLQEDFVAFFSLETINEVLRESTADLAAQARVQNFVPMLAERRTRERLTALTHS
jgi:arsenate reductase